MTATLTIDPRRGEIWLVDFDPSVGAEQRKLRPAVVLSLTSIGKLPLRIVVPVTSWKDRYRRYPWFVPLPAASENGLDADSGADAFQVKSVDLGRFRRCLGSVTIEELDEIAAGIALCVGWRG